MRPPDPASSCVSGRERIRDVQRFMYDFQGRERKVLRSGEYCITVVLISGDTLGVFEVQASVSLSLLRQIEDKNRYAAIAIGLPAGLSPHRTRQLERKSRSIS